MTDEPTQANSLTHFDRAGRARMVDVGGKDETERVAVASGRVVMRPETVELIRQGRAAKGDVLAVAQVAAVMGAKRTPDLVPMCHPLMLTRIDVSFEVRDAEVGIQAEVAYAMVQLGTSLEEVNTALDLEEGLAFLDQMI